MKIPSRRQATAIELSAVLVQIVVEPGAGEAEMVQSLAQELGVPAGMVQLEMLHARAFAIDMALKVSLGEGREADQLRDQYAARLRAADADPDVDAWDLMQDRLETYASVVDAQDAADLASTVGRCFAGTFGQAAAPMAGDLMHLGSRLFGTLFEEVSALLAEIELIEVESDDFD